LKNPRSFLQNKLVYAEEHCGGTPGASLCCSVGYPISAKRYGILGSPCCDSTSLLYGNRQCNPVVRREIVYNITGSSPSPTFLHAYVLGCYRFNLPFIPQNFVFSKATVPDLNHTIKPSFGCVLFNSPPSYNGMKVNPSLCYHSYSTGWADYPQKWPGGLSYMQLAIAYGCDAGYYISSLTGWEAPFSPTTSSCTNYQTVWTVGGFSGWRKYTNILPNNSLLAPSCPYAGKRDDTYEEEEESETTSEEPTTEEPTSETTSEEPTSEPTAAGTGGPPDDEEVFLFHTIPPENIL